MSEKARKVLDVDCLNAMLSRQKPARVIHWEMYPVCFAAIQAGKTIYDAYADPKFSYESQKRIARETGWLFQPIFPSIGGGWGGEYKLLKDDYAQAPIPVRYPVEDEAEVWKLEAPEVASLPSVKGSMDFCKLAVQEKIENETFNVTFNVSGPFTTSAELCGMNRLGRWMLRNPELVHRLLRLTTDHIIEGAALWWDTFKGADILFTLSEPMSANQVISPKQFEEFAFPYIKEIHEKVLAMGYKHIFCHICGDHNGNLPYWAQMPMGDPGIISIGHQIELETAARFFPNDIIYGNIDPIIIQIGTPKQVYEATRQIVEKGKAISNGFVFAPGCELPPKASLENIKTMMRAVEDFGWYE